MTLPSRDARTDEDVIAAKRRLRRERVASRAARSLDQRLADDERRDLRVLELLRGLGVLPASTQEPPVVACYLSVDPSSERPEPGTLTLVESLHRQGVRVLVPKLSPTPTGPRHDPDWAWYAGADDLVPGLWGIPEPAGEGVGGAALAAAGVVLCSALAVTRDGRRLGVGGGWYDRALTARPPGSRLVALVDDEDVLDDLPTEPHDQLVDAVVTPRRTIRTTEAWPDSAR